MLIDQNPERFQFPVRERPEMQSTPRPKIPIIDDKKNLVGISVEPFQNRLILESADLNELFKTFRDVKKTIQTRFNFEKLFNIIEFSADDTIISTQKKGNLLEKLRKNENSKLKKTISEIFDDKETFDVSHVTLISSEPLDNTYYRIKFAASSISPNRELQISILGRFNTIKELENEFNAFDQKLQKIKNLFGDVKDV